MRSLYEHFVDNVTSKEFGSDGMPVANFFGKFFILLSKPNSVVLTYHLSGVAMHEICLCFMITNVKHPIVFVVLVMADVLENGMFSLFLFDAKLYFQCISLSHRRILFV